MPISNPTIAVECLVGGKPFRAYSITINGSSQGNSGSADFHTTIEALAEDGIDLDELYESASKHSLEMDVYVTVDEVRTHIFGGQFQKYTFDYDNDQVAIHCRDWAGPLMDKKAVYTGQNKGLNKTVSDIVEVPHFDLTFEAVEPDPLVAGGATSAADTGQLDPDVGSVFGSNDTIFAPVPQTPWALVSKLARGNGYEAYVDPDKKLVMGEPGAVGETITLAYQMSPVPEGMIACENLKIERSPTRNANFKHSVKSYHPQQAAVTEGTATDGDGGDGGPEYTQHHDGLTAPQAQNYADAAAADILKREFLMECETDIFPTLRCLQPVRINGPTLNPLHAAQDYYVSGFTHTIGISEGARGRGATASVGTVIKCLRPTKRKANAKPTNAKGSGQLQ